MNALNKIANYFRDYNGIDEDIANIQLSTDDLRFIANLHVELCRARASVKIVDYLKNKHFDIYSELLDEMAIKNN